MDEYRAPFCAALFLTAIFCYCGRTKFCYPQCFPTLTGNADYGNQQISYGNQQIS